MKSIFCFVWLLASVPAWACSCGGWPSAKDAWKDSPVVFLGTVEKADSQMMGEHYIGEQTVIAHVDEAFKGAKKDRAFTLKQPGHNCAPKFKEGERVLFYLHPGEKPDEWEAPGCHRTRGYASAKDDLLFLHRLPTSAVGNRLSGEVELYEDGPQGFRKVRALAGVKVTATSDKGLAVTTTTNADGVYEWYGLPEGDYKLGIEVPEGLRIRFPITTGNRRRSDGETIHLDADSGVSVSYLLMANTKVSGRVLDPSGKTMDGVCVDIRPVSANDEGNSRIFDCTKSGKFELEMMPPGQYYVVANRSGRVSADVPFPMLYYPGTTDLKQAIPVTVPEGGSVDNIDIRVPLMRKSLELSGRVVFSDGVPVPQAYVKFASQSETYQENAVAQADGSFRMRILDGTLGELSAEIIVSADESAACPQFRVTIPAGVFGTSLRSVSVAISEESAASEIKLVMQVPSCKSWGRRR